MSNEIKYKKYPRTFHLPFSEGVTSDDKVQHDLSVFNDEIVVTKKMDGENCLDGATVVITDIGPQTIESVCKNKYKGKILGINSDNYSAEFSDILAHKIGNECDDWYEIEMEDGTILILTGEHRVFMKNENCYRMVKNLKLGDVLLKK